jgi:hypothetical protein
MMLNAQQFGHLPMMISKKLFCALCVGTIVCSTVDANAALISRGGGLLYDEELNVTWIADFDLLGTVSSKNANMAYEIIEKVQHVLIENNGYDSYDQPSLKVGVPYRLTQADFRISAGGASSATWYGAQAFAGTLVYGGISGWRVAGQLYLKNDVYTNELQHLFKDTLSIASGGIGNAEVDNFANSAFAANRGFWMGDNFEGGSNGLVWLTSVDFSGASTSINRWGTMFVHDGDIAAVSEPAMITMFSLGLLLLTARVRR